MSRLAAFAALAFGGAVLAACASDDDGPRQHVGLGHHRHGAEGGPGLPSISPDVFLFLPYDLDHDHRIGKNDLAAAIAGSWQELAGSRASVRLLDVQDWFAKIEGAAAVPFNALEFSPDAGDSITRDEFALALTHRFEVLDTNKDGVLEPSEFMTILRMERGGGVGGRHRHSGGEEGGGPY